MDYSADVESDAVSFIDDNEESIKEAIVDELGFYDAFVDDVEQWFHESIVDRAYTLQDAAYIIENCRNRESDSGMWEGQEMEDAMQTCAAYSYGNDVREIVEELYDELKSDYEDELEDVRNARREELMTDADTINRSKNDGVDLEESVEEGLELEDDVLKETAIDNVFTEFTFKYSVHPIESGGHDEVYRIRRWLKLNENASTWSGYPVGQSYIDSRCGTGHSMPDIKDYVDFDQRVGMELPDLRGKNREQMKERLVYLENILGKLG